MMGFLPNFCHIKYKQDSLNSTNNPQKSEFEDKGGEESNKVKKNISKILAGNRTAVVIRARIETIKGRGQAKGKGSKKGKGKGMFRRKISLRERERERERERVIYCNT